jgi:hypothetical protein
VSRLRPGDMFRTRWLPQPVITFKDPAAARASDLNHAAGYVRYGLVLAVSYDGTSEHAKELALFLDSRDQVLGWAEPCLFEVA